MASSRRAAVTPRPGRPLRAPTLGRRRGALAARARAGDADAQQELITANLALVLHAARDYKHRGVPLDDLIQEGNLALVRAARHFDPATHAARFATYANYWIRRFIVRALGTNSLVLQGQGDARYLRLQYREAVAELVARDTAAARQARLEPAEYRRGRPIPGVSARRLAEAWLARHDQVAHQSLAELTPTDEPSPDQAVVTDEDRAIVCAVLQRLSPFEAWVISERFGLDDPPGLGIRRVSTTRDPQSDSKTTEAPAAGSTASGARPRQAYFERSYIEMSKDCGLSVLRLRQVEKTALDKLRAFLGRRI